MRKITPDKLDPGMTLAKPILRGSTVFLGEGMLLSESAIARIRGMEIEHVFVEGQAEQPVSREEALALLDQRFRNSDDNRLMMHIKNIVREHITELYD